MQPELLFRQSFRLGHAGNSGRNFELLILFGFLVILNVGSRLNASAISSVGDAARSVLRVRFSDRQLILRVTAPAGNRFDWRFRLIAGLIEQHEDIRGCLEAYASVMAQR